MKDASNSAQHILSVMLSCSHYHYAVIIMVAVIMLVTTTTPFVVRLALLDHWKLDCGLDILVGDLPG